MEALSNKRRSRRSTPSLGELHITPMTRDPLVGSPFVEDEEYDPAATTSQGRSYLSSRSLPQTPSILSRSPSRTRSRSRSGRRNAKSMLTLTALDDTAAFPDPNGGPLTPGPYGPGSLKRQKSAIASGRVTPGRVRVVDRERTDFLLRTASLLVESASESKGQGWISKRNSSTNLAPVNWEELRMEAQRERVGDRDRDRDSVWAADDEYSPAWSRIDANLASRRNSRRGSMSNPASHRQSRRASRVSLSVKTPGSVTPREGYFDDMSVEFADERLWEESSDEEEIDEGELKRLLRRRVGGFFEDIFGGWLDFRGEEEEDDIGDSGVMDEEKEREIIEAANRGDEAAKRKLKFVGIKRQDIVKVKPPEDVGGTWSDARWLVGLARRALV